MENKCYFVCSRGILKSCSFHSLNPTSSCGNDSSYLYNMLENNQMFEGMSIYVCSDLLCFFVNNILDKIHNKFILVTGDSDLTVPREAINNDETVKLVNNVYLVKWFIQNTNIQNHIKICQLPIGLDYHTISTTPTHSWRTKNEGYLPREQEFILVKLRQNMKPFYERIPKIYVNFTTSNDRFSQRKLALRQIPPKLLHVNNQFTKRTNNWKIMTNFTFVLSPFGIGMDCHRTWEALCLGCIPILNARNFKKMFEDLPVIIVSDWSEVTVELLKNTIQNFKTREFKYEKLTLQYWNNLINNT